MRSATSTEGVAEAAGESETGRGERAAAWSLLLLTLAVRIVYVFRYRIDSDEPQLLHVVWAWVHGLLPYRDVFDNHTPLFHLLAAPVFAIAGERPGVLFTMRLAMIPLYVISLWAVHTIGSKLYSRRVGMWAAAITAPCWGFFACSVQFRGDDLWAALWLAALSVFVSGPPTPRRSWLTGLLLGAALSTSLKTSVMLFSLGAALLAVAAFTRGTGILPGPRRLALGAAAGSAGLLLVPLALALYFVLKGAWPQLYYGIVGHNVLSGFDWWEGGAVRLALFPIALPLLWWGARRIVRGSPGDPAGARRGTIFLTNGIYAVSLLGGWPVLTRQDFLPFFPLLVIAITPPILELPARLAERSRAIGRWVSRAPRAAAPGLVAGIEIAVLLAAGPLSRDGTREPVALLGEVLRLTDPNQTILDLKGETIFRPRPSFYVFEKITNERFRRGDIQDVIPDSLVASGTCVAVRHGQLFPPRTRAFLDANFIRVGRLRVAGRWLVPSAPGGSGPLPFDVGIPARYAIVAERGPTRGTLDGIPYEGPRLLEPGRHVFERSEGGGTLAVLWAQAVERGFTPFPFRKGSSQAAGPRAASDAGGRS